MGLCNCCVSEYSNEGKIEKGDTKEGKPLRNGMFSTDGGELDKIMVNKIKDPTPYCTFRGRYSR